MRDLLADLNEQQQEVVRSTHGPVLVLAGAGSGKTRALTYRIAYLLKEKVASPEEVLAVTFTNKAAGEMKERVAGLLKNSNVVPAAISTFHSLGANILRQYSVHTSRSKGFMICDGDDSLRLIRTVMDEVKISRREFNPKNIKAKISTAKNNMEDVVDYAQRAMSREEEVTAMVWAGYKKKLAENDAYDFDDLIVAPISLLADNPEVRKAYQNLWKFISVDEYQDTNAPQDKLLKLLIGPNKNICVVGDDYQAIYSWRGARVDHILNFAKNYPGCKTIYMTRNYRSTPFILSAANSVIAQNQLQKHKKLWTSDKRGEGVKLVKLSSGQQEAGWVRKKITDYVKSGGQRGNCVILYRTNAQSRSLEEQFLMYGVPYTIVGGFRFYDRREIKDALSFLTLWVNPNSFLSVQRIAESQWKGVGPKTVSKWMLSAQEAGISLWDVINQKADKYLVLRPLVNSFEKAKKTLKVINVSELLQFLLEESGYIRWLKRQPDGEERLENIEELYNVTSGFESVEKFLEEVALLSDIDTLKEESDRVTCMTLHAAKGLEFKNVFIIGCEEGLLPHKNSLGKAADLEEERRLLYVGITRAEEKLFLSYALTRYMGGEAVVREPSRFLNSLLDQVELVDESFSADKSWSDILGSEEGGEDNLIDGEPVVINCEEGDFINHDKFGRGVVIEIRGSAVTCVFERGGVRVVDSADIRTKVV
jgi:DNA helicase-2/ATP-dependent DNA helicase PcrA